MFHGFIFILIQIYSNKKILFYKRKKKKKKKEKAKISKKQDRKLPIKLMG